MSRCVFKQIYIILLLALKWWRTLSIASVRPCVRPSEILVNATPATTAGNKAKLIAMIDLDLVVHQGRTLM